MIKMIAENEMETRNLQKNTIQTKGRFGPGMGG